MEIGGRVPTELSEQDLALPQRRRQHVGATEFAPYQAQALKSLELIRNPGSRSKLPGTATTPQGLEGRAMTVIVQDCGEFLVVKHVHNLTQSMTIRAAGPH